MIERVRCFGATGLISGRLSGVLLDRPQPNFMRGRMSLLKDRRSFMSVLASFSGWAAVWQESNQAAYAQTTAGTEKWDLAWLDQLAGKHKQVYDYGSFDLTADLR